MSTANVGPQARVSGTWRICRAYMFHNGGWSNIGPFWELKKAYARVSGTWEVWATNLENGLSTSTSDRSRFDFDFSSPFFTEAGVKIMANGNVQMKDSGGGYSNSGSQWLDYFNRHDSWNYGITISDDDSENLDTNSGYVDGVEEEIISTNYDFQSTRTTVGEESGRFSCTFTDWDSPGPKQTHLDFRLQVSIENNPF